MEGIQSRRDLMFEFAMRSAMRSPSEIPADGTKLVRKDSRGTDMRRKE